MSKESSPGSKHPFWTSLGGILTGLATLITAVVSIYQITKTTSAEEKSTNPQEINRCSEPFVWDSELETCVKKGNVPKKTFSIPLNEPISEVHGNIYFYLNRERLPDVNGKPKYKEAPGVIQVVIPIMREKKMVGSHREVIYSTTAGKICKIASLWETTGHAKAMKAVYALGLGLDCKERDGVCYAQLIQSGNRVHLTLNELAVIVGKDCPD